MNTYVFVYGTLKKGYRMGDWLNSNATFVGEGATPGLLYDLSAFPGFKKNSTDEDQQSYMGPVHGEVYEVTDKSVLDRMDVYEGVSTGIDGRDIGLYRKIRVPVLMSDCQVLTNVLVYEYNQNTNGMTPIKGGVWK